MKKAQFFFIALLFFTAIIVRLYKIGSPLADWHSFRQSDTAAVARNFLKFGFDPFRPRYDDLSNIQSGRDNPMGWRMVEFPLYQLVAASVRQLNPAWSIDLWLRLTTIAASAGTTVILTLLVSQFVNPATGLLTGFIYAVLPYSIYYGRVILPEPFAVFWAMLSLLLLSKILWGEGNRGDWGMIVLAGLAGAVALLVKPTAGFLLLPAVYLYIRRYGFSKHSFIRLPARHRFAQALAGGFVYSFICLLPFILWRRWIPQFPEGIPAYEWLLNANNIRFKGAWFWWLFAERLGKLILGYWGLIPFGLGILVKPEKGEGSFFRWWILGALTYLIVFAAGNVQHDYYQILLLPVVSIYLAKGFVFLFTSPVFSKLITYNLLLITFLFMLAFSWYTIRTYYWINRPEIVEAGKLADQLLPKDAKVIAPYNGDTTFLYQNNRQGWPLGFDIDKKIEMGATHYVTVSPTDSDWETKELAEKYTVLVRNDKFAIIDLTKPKR